MEYQLEPGQGRPRAPPRRLRHAPRLPLPRRRRADQLAHEPPPREGVGAVRRRGRDEHDHRLPPQGRDGVGAGPRGVRLRLVRQVLEHRHERGRRDAVRDALRRRLRGSARARPGSSSCSTGATSSCPPTTPRAVYGVVIDEAPAARSTTRRPTRCAPSSGPRGARVTVYREVNELPRCGSCGKLLTVGGIEASRLGHTLVFCSRAVHPRLRHLQGAEVRRRRGLARVHRLVSGRLGGKVAIVTGATEGIGRAVAGAFAREGARLVLVARREQPGVRAGRRARRGRRVVRRRRRGRPGHGRPGGGGGARALRRARRPRQQRLRSTSRASRCSTRRSSGRARSSTSTSSAPSPCSSPARA